MDEVISKIIELHKKLFDENPKIEKLNVGFTNTIYSANDSYIIKM
jgi:hypothetical protein